MSAIAWTTIKPALIGLFASLSGLQCVWLDKKRPHIDPKKQAICFLWVKSCTGYGVDDQRLSFDIDRHSTESTVSLTCTLEDGTELVSGEAFATDGVHRWTPVVDYTATETGPQAVPFRAEFPGPFAAAIGAIDTIDTPVVGWSACTNAVAATLGTVGTEYRFSIEGLRRIVLACKIESFNHEDDRFAFTTIENIRSGLDWPSSKAVIKGVGCALIRHYLSQEQANVIIDDRLVSVTQADIVLCAPATSVDSVGVTWIETLAPITATLT